jgi:ATP-dependent helicase HrpB
VRDGGLAALPLGERSRGFLERLAFAHAGSPGEWPDLCESTLIDRLGEWLEPLLPGRSSLASLSDGDLEGALKSLLPWDRQRALEAAVPLRFTAPTGSTFAIDYAAEGGPRVDVRVQELYGLAEHPTVAGTPLTLALLSPAHRPIQLTKDLPGFWKGSWKDVRSDMRGRYPKHVWPEDPAIAAPTTRAKPRGT